MTSKTDYQFFQMNPGDQSAKVFDIDHCEVCGCEVVAPNSVTYCHTRTQLNLMGMEEKGAPRQELCYSEIHGCGTCELCCHAEPTPERKYNDDSVKLIRSVAEVHEAIAQAVTDRDPDLMEVLLQTVRSWLIPEDEQQALINMIETVKQAAWELHDYEA